MMNLNQARWWNTVTEECRLHIERIHHALSRIKHHLPITTESAENLTDDDVAFLDQLIYRFLKLQDTMGEKLFPLTLLLLGEDFESKPFIDILNRLERLELIPSRAEWSVWRELRNDLTHEYPDNRDERTKAINKLSGVVDQLVAVFDGICVFIETKGS